VTRPFIHALLEGAADVPVMREILTRRFGLTETLHFDLHPHNGKGKLPENLHQRPSERDRTLLHQLPAKLRAYADLGQEVLILVVVDADDTPEAVLLNELDAMLSALQRRPPRVLFRLAIEETESWFLADPDAIAAAYPAAKIQRIQKIDPDAVVGAWERLAECLGRKGQSAPKDKFAWAERIAPHMNFTHPRSPSLRKLLDSLVAEHVEEA
jgi:hypothetical protein